MSTPSNDSAAAPVGTAANPLGQLRAAHEALQRLIDQRAPGDAPADRHTEHPAAAGAPRAPLAGHLSDTNLRNGSLERQLAKSQSNEEQLRRTLAENQIERHALLAELQMLRVRCIKLAEDLCREQQHAQAERQLWNSELGQWRRMLETHFVRLSGSPRIPPDPQKLGGLDLAAPAAKASLPPVLEVIEHRAKADQ